MAKNLGVAVAGPCVVGDPRLGVVLIEEALTSDVPCLLIDPKGDLVTEVGGEKVPDGIALIVAIRSHQPGDTVSFTVERGGTVTQLRITLGSQVG